MTCSTEVLKLPICPVCKDTKGVRPDPRASVGAFCVCVNCDVRWGERFVSSTTDGPLVDRLFPDRKPRVFGGGVVRSPDPVREWWMYAPDYQK